MILLYDKTSECTRVDQCRKQLFAKGIQVDHIPPTEAALKEHIKQVVYQAVCCWVKPLLYMYISSYRALKNGNGKSADTITGSFLDVTSRSSKGVQRADQMRL